MTMKRKLETQIRIAKSQIVIGGQELPLISGEFHFWRVQKSNWGSILETIKDAGIKIISTYVAWSYHELEPGVFDFCGDTCPERDLKGFIRIARDMGLYLIIKPGPFIYAEWPGGGPPERAAGLHRLSPEFLKMTGEYINKVCAVIKPYLATNKGNIVLLQVDNEPWPDLCARAEEIGVTGGTGMFSEWLKEQYNGNISVLNRKWRSAYKSFTEVAIFFEECYINRSLPLNGRLLPWPRYTQRFIDSQKFVEFYATGIISTIAGMYRKAGMDIPLYMNGWHPYAQNFHQAKQVVDLAGIDGLHRHSLYFDPEGAEFEDEYLYYLEAFKMLLHDTENGYAAEMGIGHPAGRMLQMKFAPKVENNIFDYLLYMANGMKAWNWYTLVDRDEWCCGAINQFGQPTTFFPAIKEALKIAESIDVSSLESLQNCSLITHRGHRYTDSGNWNRVWNALLEADFDFSLLDPEYKRPDSQILFYAGSDWLPAKAYASIKNYLDQGGTIVFFSHIPVANEYGEYTNPLDLPEPDMVRPVSLPVTIACAEHKIELKKGGHNDNKVHFVAFRQLPENYKPLTVHLSSEARQALVDTGLARGERKMFITGYVRPYGKGRILYLGANPQAQFVDFLREVARVSAVIRTDTPGVLTHIWRNSEGSLIIFAVNLSKESRHAIISLDTNYLDISGKKKIELIHVRSNEKEELMFEKENKFPIFLKGHDIWVGRLKG